MLPVQLTQFFREEMGSLSLSRFTSVAAISAGVAVAPTHGYLVTVSLPKVFGNCNNNNNNDDDDDDQFE